VKVLKSKITGLSIKHQGIAQLSTFIANQTHPPVSVRATIIQEESHNVDAIEFPKFSRLVATSDGLLKQRRSIYRQLGQSADYIRQVGFDRIQQKKWSSSTFRNTVESSARTLWIYADSAAIRPDVYCNICSQRKSSLPMDSPGELTTPSCNRALKHATFFKEHARAKSFKG
jgi:hypothetical protein